MDCLRRPARHRRRACKSKVVEYLSLRSFGEHLFHRTVVRTASQVGREQTLELPSRAMQTRFDRARVRADDLGDFRERAIFILEEHERLALKRRQSVNGSAQDER